MLKKLFLSIREKEGSWWKISGKGDKKPGKQLEENFAEELKEIGFKNLDKEELIDKEEIRWEQLKKEVKKKGNNEIITNNFPSWTINKFVYSPRGSQNYPDFLIFTSKYIIPIELKSSESTATKPMWNSHLPRGNGLYIFVSHERNDITFFRGIDVIDERLHKKLVEFFQKEGEIKSFEEEFNKNLPKSERGWKVYIRIAYDQVKSLLLPQSQGELNYFKHPHREDIEDKVLEWLEGKD